jgi:outer membrane lipoprotein-sorting protein
MNCAECKDLLVLGLEGLLDDSQKQAVREHLKTCESCRAELQELQTLRRRLVGNGKALAQTSVEDNVMDRIIQEQNARLKSAQQAGTGLRIRRLIMRNSIVKIAAAAALVAIALGAWSLWSGTQPGVALADVLAKVEQVRALTYRMDNHTKVTMPGVGATEVNMEMTWLISDDYGMRLDTRSTDPTTGQVMEQQLYLQPGQKVMMMLDPAKKQYARMPLGEEAFKEKRKETNDPRMMIQQLLGCKYTDLGTTVLDGVEVQGFQSTDPAFIGGTGDVDIKVWVDVKTQFPFRVDMALKMSDEVETQSTIRDFQWDVPVSAAEFTPVIPPDYTPSPTDGTKAAMPTEQGAVEGLQFCVEFTGVYPKSLDMSSLMDTMQLFMNSQTPAARKFKEESAQIKSKDEQLARAMEIARPIQSLTMFHMMLSQEKKEPAYYGNVVTPGDKALVLMRWKTGDNQYRVLFGDLHAETVDAETLARLEAALPK